MIKGLWMFAIKLVGTSMLCYWLLKSFVENDIGSTVYKSLQLTPQINLSITYSLIGVASLWVISMMYISMKFGK